MPVLSKERAKASALIASGKHPATFRRFINHVYRDKVYDTYAQGHMSKGKIKYGMREYMLTRASRYGNLCRDCAAVLDFAPGLLQKNHRLVNGKTGLTSQDRVLKDKDTLTYWERMRALLREAGKPDIDILDLMHSNKKVSDAEYDRAMDTFVAFLKERNTFLGKTTKYATPPDIYVQKAINLEGGTMTDYKLINEALGDLRKLRDKEIVVAGINVSNPAFRDLITEISRKYEHTEKLQAEPQIKKFDPDMIRREDRNYTEIVKFRDSDGSERQHTFHNCLKTSLYQPKHGLYAGKTIVTKPGAENYLTKVYYANKIGEAGNCQDFYPGHTKKSMWCGDDYVTRSNGGSHWVLADTLKNNKRFQMRRLRQTRLFITYSLHRPIENELEGRAVLEKMADASRELFGNDINLAELLVFGYKLTGFDGAGETTDTISRARFAQITAPNKKEAEKDFTGI